MCPIILAMLEHPELEPHVCITAQHRKMLDQVLDVFGVVPDLDLNLMQPNQNLAGLTARGLTGLDAYLGSHPPAMVLVQGDTTTAFVAALAAFYHHIPVGHVEAGLRTWDRLAPFPEEINRTLVSRLADYHFAPTEVSKQNLIKEGLHEQRIFVTGNTVVDALQMAINRIRSSPPFIPGLPDQFLDSMTNRPLVLITGHRRESFGAGFRQICEAIAQLANRFPETAFVYPVHLNPNVRKPVFELLDGRSNVFLIEPLDYPAFIALMDRCRLVLTDSGGIQEEAPSIGKPVLVMRATTERPEVIESGNARLVGTECATIVHHVTQLLLDKAACDKMASASNPYGDGKAAERIVATVANVLRNS